MRRGSKQLLHAINGAMKCVEDAGRECDYIRRVRESRYEVQVAMRMKMLLQAQHAQLTMFREYIEGFPTLTAGLTAEEKKEPEYEIGVVTGGWPGVLGEKT